MLDNYFEEADFEFETLDDKTPKELGDLTRLLPNFSNQVLEGGKVVYLPAIMKVLSEGGAADKRLNFLDKDGLIYYPACLQAHNEQSNKATILDRSTRASNTYVLGDSGGYQILENNPGYDFDWLNDRSKAADVIESLLDWYHQNCNEGVILDVPSGTPIRGKHKYITTSDQCLEITKLNIEEMIRQNENEFPLLNVVQVFYDNQKTFDWIDEVKHYPLNGWSIGSDFKNPYNVLAVILRLDNLGLLKPPRNRIHLLGAGSLNWYWFLKCVAAYFPHVKFTMDSSNSSRTSGQYGNSYVAKSKKSGPKAVIGPVSKSSKKVMRATKNWDWEDVLEGFKLEGVVLDHVDLRQEKDPEIFNRLNNMWVEIRCVVGSANFLSLPNPVSSYSDFNTVKMTVDSIMQSSSRNLGIEACKRGLLWSQKFKHELKYDLANVFEFHVEKIKKEPEAFTDQFKLFSERAEKHPKVFWKWVISKYSNGEYLTVKDEKTFVLKRRRKNNVAERKLAQAERQRLQDAIASTIIQICYFESKADALSKANKDEYEKLLREIGCQ